ncbi:hypothetical protein EVAR_46668_1 [Eumeta japonica]|uniref:Uncharacterized protein n=1 Tax=Eumeta variegata TaxID=151549 RepID=A0A4C1Y472_EUMVA|nr:hypothetical protein EVAR_46668_1 [Eumeta japonica]
MALCAVSDPFRAVTDENETIVLSLRPLERWALVRTRKRNNSSIFKMSKPARTLSALAHRFDGAMLQFHKTIRLSLGARGAGRGVGANEETELVAAGGRRHVLAVRRMRRPRPRRAPPTPNS